MFFGKKEKEKEKEKEREDGGEKEKKREMCDEGDLETLVRYMCALQNTYGDLTVCDTFVG